jgi:CDP-6-deoxy-D-xylo-4-hexulose-3-dehydrase
MNEVAAAFGLEQLKRLTRFTQKRKKNFEKLYNFFSNYEEHFHLPELIKGATTNWLAFPLTIRKEAPFKRYDLLKHLEKDGIQTRVLFSGNITRHPVYKDNPLTWRQVGELSKSDFIMANGFLIGAHQGMGDREIEIIADSAMRFFNQYE